MKPRPRRLIALTKALAGAALLCGIGQAQGAAKWALSVGIDDYQADSVPDLRGCANDVQLVKSDLIGRFGFPQENVKTLTNADATHAGIVAAIRGHLTANAAPGDIVLLHFSGHGSQMPDAPGGDEIDGLDETLVPYDSRTPEVFDISDDETNGLMQELTAKTDHVVFWLDSCHSGSASRGGAQVREIPPDKRPPPAAPDYAVSARGAEGDANIRLKGSKYVLISGCLPHELSNEGQFGGSRHGALTWFLHEALMTAGSGATYRSAFDEATAAVHKEYPSQTPQIEGPGQNVALLGTAEIPSAITVPIVSVAGNQVTLGAGQAQLLGVGSLLDVYPPGTGDFAASKPVAKLKVTASRDFDAQADVIEGGAIPVKAKAVLVEAVYGTAPIAAYITPAARSVLPKLPADLGSRASLRLVDEADRAGARLIVDRVDDHIAIQGGDTVARFPPVPIGAPDLSDHVLDQIDQVAHWLSVLGLKNLAGGLNVDLSLRRPDQPADTPTPQQVSGARDPNAPPDAVQALYLAVRVKNNSNSAIYPYVLDISSDGSIALLYPEVGGSQQALPPNESKDVTQILPLVPAGHDSVSDTFKLIATTKPIDPRAFPQGSIRDIAATRGPSTGDPLSDFLTKAMRGERAAVVRVASGSWGTAERTIVIGESGLRHEGFAVHLKEPAAKGAIALGKRSACDAGSGRDCLEAVQADADGKEWELVRRTAQRGGADPLKSVGAAFDEAYALADQTPGVLRVEPLLEAPMPQSEVLAPDATAAAARGGDGKTPNPAALADDHWGLKMIRAAGAWERLRQDRGAPDGAEARGIAIGHIDTGYTRHPEVWNENQGIRPIDPARGRDYFDGDNDPADPLLTGQPLDNPGHATVAGSVIVSPPGCQIDDPDGCVTGVAPGAQLIPLRVHRTVAQVNTYNIARAIRDLARGAIPGHPRIASVAMGGPPSLTLFNAVREAERNGILVIAAAGNEVGATVWPANFDSAIAVTAVNVQCRPWSHGSFGEGIDISAPGEDVWRASVWPAKGSKLGSLGSSAGPSAGSSASPSAGPPAGAPKVAYDIWMGDGTTYATGHTSGAAALWLAYHQDDPALARLIREGRLAGAFRRALAASAWRPAADPTRNPPGVHCTTSDWDTQRYGPGILDVAALLAQPLEPGPTTAGGSERLPLFGSLYPAGTSAAKIESDYLGLFGESRAAGTPPADPDRFETELMLHYTLNDAVRRSIDALVQGRRDLDPYAAIKASLRGVDLSDRLRTAVGS